MKLRLALLTLSACISFSLTSQASDISYTITGGTLTTSTALTGSFSGSFLIDSVGEFIDGGSITAIAPTGGNTYSFFNAANDSSTPGAASFIDAAGDIFDLNLNGPIGGLAFNTLASNGTGGDTKLILAGGLQFDATGGVIKLSSVSATPEPSSLILLGTGALGLAGSLRRRFVNA